MAGWWLPVCLVLWLCPGTAGAKEVRVIKLEKSDVDTLARTLYGEARGEGIIGMQAVAWVVVNRAARGPARFPTTISGVVKQAHQFTCWSKSDPNSALCAAVDESDPAFVRALYAAAGVLSGLVPDMTEGSDHYFVTKMAKPPAWASKMRLIKRIGAHSFFKEPR